MTKNDLLPHHSPQIINENIETETWKIILGTLAQQQIFSMMPHVALLLPARKNTGESWSRSSTNRSSNPGAKNTRSNAQFLNRCYPSKSLIATWHKNIIWFQIHVKAPFLTSTKARDANCKCSCHAPNLSLFRITQFTVNLNTCKNGVEASHRVQHRSSMKQQPPFSNRRTCWTLLMTMVATL